MAQTGGPQLALDLKSNSTINVGPSGHNPPPLTPRASARGLRKPAAPRPQPQQQQPQQQQQQPQAPVPQRKPAPKSAETPPRGDSLKPLPSSPSSGPRKHLHASAAADAPAPTPASPQLSESPPRSASPSDSNGSRTESDNTITTATSSTMTLADPPVAPPLTRVHFNCYHFHRNFAVSNNKHNPLPCMTCLKSNDKDANRWRCTFCCLRVCPDCHQGLEKCKDKSLIQFMENLLNNLEGQGKGDEEGNTGDGNDD